MATMEDILSTQQQIANAVEQLLTNFKKDGAERKTADYIKRRLETLENYWHEFQANHTTMCSFGVRSHTYFTSNQYEAVKERFDNIRAMIQNYQFREDGRPSTPLLKPPTLLGGAGTSQLSPSVSKGTNSKTEEMLRKQASNFRAFQRTISGINLGSVVEKWEFDDLLHTLQTRWSVIDTLHWELDSILEGSNKEYEDMYSNYEQIYSNMKKSINKKLWSTSFSKKTTPQMEIPNFHGNYRQWTSFRDLFTETIHKNPSLSGAQKMQFLKGKVKGEAERLIQHLTISSDNYAVCWDILNHRYNNKKLLFMSQASILLNIPVSPKLSVSHIKRIHATTNECLNAIKNLGIDVSSWDPLLIYILSQKLDTETNTEYLQSLKEPRELPVLQEFLNFLESKFITLETSARKTEIKSNQMNNSDYQSSSSNSLNKQSKPQYQKQSFYTNRRAESASETNISRNQIKSKCPVCDTIDHGIFYCQKFLDMSPDEKKRTVKNYNLCNNCLYTHYNKACLSEKRCRTCNGNHNTILHESFVRGNVTPAATTSKSVSNKLPNTGEQTRGHWNSHVSLKGNAQEVLLPTAVIMVQSADGTFIKMRALLDQGSQTSLITENALQQLGLPRQKLKGVVSGVGSKSSSCTGATSITFTSINGCQSFQTDAIIMQSLINNLPNISFAKPTWSCLDNIQLADPEFNISRPIDILLGGEVYSEIILEGICKSDTFPTAQQTCLGWILCGKAVKTLQCNVVLNNMEDISRFWEIEDIPHHGDPSYSSDDQKCIDYYKNTTKRCSDGKYEVRLPLKQTFQENFGSSKYKAIAQFKQLERKFIQQKEIGREYKLFINEYLSLGHMSLACNNGKTDNNKFYLPHHCVHKADSTTTKLRVVFNASSKTTSGYSLNDLMYRGPNLQQDLQSLIITWRQFKYGFTADIEKMFRMIWLNESDQDLQRIIWRDYPGEQLKEYRLTTVTYGTKAAPFLARMTLRQLAQDEKVNYPNSSAINILETASYMDDYLYGSQDIETGKRLQQDLINILRSGGFNLRKWKSNAPELLQNVDSAENDQAKYDFKHMESTKTLGLSWNPGQDTFNFQYNLDANISISTKRTLLSNISKLFDPLGWLSPVTTKLKIIFQKVWSLNIQWDDALPDTIHKEWIAIREDLNNINQYQIERWIRTREEDLIELHGFCDASTKAYACVIYCKINRPNNISVTLIAGKARLVPTSKSVSLPRLELCGAVLLSRLMAKVQKCLNSYNIKTYGWVDSMVVVGWLKGDVSRWTTFVANRVTQITSVMPADQWNYVKSEENPADCASRGLSPSQLKDHHLWWRGPTWLLEHNIPENKNLSLYTTDQEVKKNIKVNALKIEGESIIQQLIKNCSSYMKIVRVLAIVLRFISKKQKKGTFLSLQEIHKAKSLLSKYIQQQAFSEEIIELSKSNKIKTSSKIINLNPYLDEEGILRVGGRLRKAYISEDMKHPVILPNNNQLTNLIIDHGHEITLHGGPKLTSTVLRKKFWILGGNRAIKKRLRLCVTCKKHNPSKHYQLMGDLPEPRCNPSRPFYHTGVDYTGFIDIKANKGRGIKTTKGYVALFVCMATKAIHLELVSDLTTTTFLAALRRMAARRGTPRHMYSDNGTNFLGASHVLQQQFQELQEQAIPGITNMEIEWHFNAPSWPSAGGLWEAGVKSLKHHMRRVIGEQKLTYEELTTILTQIEACLNSRPLCPMSEDPDDLDVLTPSHFLASGPNLTIYDTESDLPIRWQLARKIYHDIWRRWQSEYLSQLNARSKWKQAQSELKVNDVVIIHDLNLPPGKWAMGRVMELHPGQDGHVRVVTVKTKNGLMKRPILKLSVLPVHELSDSNQSENQHKTAKISKNILKPKGTYKPARKNLDFTTMAVTFLLFFMTLISSSQCAYNVKNLPNNQSLYFDKIINMHLIRDEWKLVVYYDMNPYWDGIKALSKNIDYLNTLCTEIDTVSHCEGILMQLRHGFQEIQHYNRMLLNQQNAARTRQGRGLIDGVGYLANSLFGVLDQRFAENYEKDIKTIEINQNHLAMLWKNQTSIVEAEFNLLKRTETIMDKQYKAINQKMLNLENTIIKIKSVVQNCTIITDFTLSSLIANNLLLELKTIQNKLIDTITDIYHGKFNLHLISPQQLKHEIDVISSQLPKDLSSPADGMEFTNIYHLLRIRARMSEHYFIFEIKIPLITRDAFEIFKITPVPHVVGSQMVEIVPISEYVAINLNKDTLLSLMQNDINSCLQQHLGTILCSIKRPIFNIKDDQSLCLPSDKPGTCKTKVSPCTDKWTETNQLNHYMFFCCETCRLRLLCPDQVTALQLSQAGLLSVGQGCVLKSQNFSLYSHKQESSKADITPDIGTLEIAPINDIINISPVPYQSFTNTSDYDATQQELSNIKNQLDVIKQSTPLTDDIRVHDVHHYAAIYSIIGIMALVGIYVSWRRLRRYLGGRVQARVEANVSPSPGAEDLTVLQPAVSTISVSVSNECCDTSVNKKDKATSPVFKSVFSAIPDN